MMGSMVADSLKCLTTDCIAHELCFDSRQEQNIFVPTMSRLALEMRPKHTKSSSPASKAARVVKPTHFHLMPNLRVWGAIPLLPHVPSWRVQGYFNVFTFLYQESKSLFISFAIWDVTHSRPSWWTWCHVDWQFVTEVLEDPVSCIFSVAQGETSTRNYYSAHHIAIEVTREQISADVGSGINY